MAIVVVVLGVGLVGLITANFIDFLMAQSVGDGETEHACPSCTANTERLARIEARLEKLLPVPGQPPRVPGDGTGHDPARS